MSCKILIVVSLIGLFAGQTCAQQMPKTPEQVDNFEKIEKYRKMRGSGAALTVIGSIVVVVGLSTVINSGYSESEFSTGAACALVGYGMLGAGIPLWIVGGVQHKKYSAKAKELSMKINVTPQQSGLGFTYRF